MLLLGANGFIGINMLRALLDDDRVEGVTVLVRAKTSRGIRDRVLATARRFHVTLPNVHKLVVLEGDYTQPDFGLAPADYGQLQRAIGAVVHAAGSTLYAPYLHHRGQGLVPMLRLIEFCLEGRVKRLEVIGSAASAAFTRRRDFFKFDLFHSGYPRNKWVTHQVAVEAHRRGVPVTMCLAPYVMGGPKTDFHDPGGRYIAYRMYSYLREIGKIYDSDVQLPCAPADCVADAVVENLFSPDPRTVYYPYMPFTARDAARLFGWQPVPMPEFIAALRRTYPLNSPGRLRTLLKPSAATQLQIKRALILRTLLNRRNEQALRTSVEHLLEIGRPVTLPGDMTPSDVIAACMRTNAPRSDKHLTRDITSPAEPQPKFVGIRP
ncbi:SDR family oxidoreductase [Nocardia sp. BMG51109]|uniref:SDR family oxidoreductase n=1 Tax=Nocardia sp. BMG51109 TaxID=1056816 RepID=UPI00046313A5|nr:SDR family oxidoreductase [Nocardia sp. BMG51109]